MKTTEEHSSILLDATKIGWHQDQLAAWQWGGRFAPITVDMALTRACNAACKFCFARLQENERYPITWAVAERFLRDAAEIGVRAVSLVSDGESTLNPVWRRFIKAGAALGMDMALGTNGYLVTPEAAEEVLPHLTYIRVNYNAADPVRNGQIMGVTPEFGERVLQNVLAMVATKRWKKLPVTIGLQQVLMPEYGEEVLPLTHLALNLGVDYLVIKHCSDDEFGSLGVDYAAYERLYPTLKAAESLSTPETQISVKWNKIGAGNKRTYAQCYGAPFILQISGSGLVAPCGMLFNDRYRKFHIGNIVEESFKAMVFSDRYWEVMAYLGSEKFDARRMCGALCLQDLPNRALDAHKKGQLIGVPSGERPGHVNFI